ncbi:hypothetical protein Tco_1151590 [Tanacetum coccineum]
MRDEADAIRNCIAQITIVIAELQVMEDQDEVHDSLLAAKDVNRGEESKLLVLHEVIAEALEENESQGNNVEILVGTGCLLGLVVASILYNLRSSVPRLCPYGGGVLEMSKLRFLTMAALYILYKLSEVANSSWPEDKMKVMFSRAWDSDESFIDLLCELCYAIWVSIIKDQRLIAELEVLGQRADVLKPLEYMREIGWDVFEG